MDDRSLFTDFWIKESGTTRKVFSRIPEGSDYRPDPKSRTAQEIAWQIVCEEKMLIEALETGKMEWNPEPMPPMMKDVLATYEAQSSALAGRWRALPEAHWNGSLEFFGQQRPASPMAWGSSSTSSITAARSRPISVRWVRLYPRSTARARTSRCKAHFQSVGWLARERASRLRRHPVRDA
jgi:hypothetical protein